jgi:16S rRNA (cytosine1402-N4)-methyltransferase
LTAHTPFHDPALLQEVLSVLVPGVTDGWVADFTVGGAGHSRELLRVTPEGVKLLGVDRDPNALRAAGARLASFGERARLRRGRFSDLRAIVEEEGAQPLRCLLLDLGVSSSQLDEAERGFSFRADGPLDMDMEARGEEQALLMLRRISLKDLARVLGAYGELPKAGTMARAIQDGVRSNKVRSTRDLASLIEKRFGWLRRGRAHPATRVFQALRMAVNDELGELDAALEHGPALLAPGGRMAVISYHSLEDRAVKRRFRDLASGGEYSLPWRKPVRPGEAEIARNSRARSAKLRAIERREGGDQ